MYSLMYNLAVGASFVPATYAVVENNTTIEVCVQIVTGVVAMEDTVEVETKSGIATGQRLASKLQLCRISMSPSYK